MCVCMCFVCVCVICACVVCIMCVACSISYVVRDVGLVCCVLTKRKGRQNE